MWLRGRRSATAGNGRGSVEGLALANAPIAKTLRPVVEESVKFETTRNLFIEGDNLEALKLLRESYLGKVKLIYIDPHTTRVVILSTTMTLAWTKRRSFLFQISWTRHAGGLWLTLSPTAGFTPIGLA